MGIGNVLSLARRCIIRRVVNTTVVCSGTESGHGCSAHRRVGTGPAVLRGLLALGLAVAVPGACASDGGGEWGPLAVMDDPATGSLDAFGGSGPVDIGERCVTLTRENGAVVLLVWRSAEVTWDEGDREVTFSRAFGDREPITIRDGDVITIGGSTTESGEDEPRDVEIDWLAEPDESCEGEWWSVHSISTGPTPAK